MAAVPSSSRAREQRMWLPGSAARRGAAGSAGYMALEGFDAYEFYAESTPVWWIRSSIWTGAWPVGKR